MSDNNQKSKALTPEEKQYTILPNEVEPNVSFAKAIAVALKAKGRLKKIQKPK